MRHVGCGARAIRAPHLATLLPGQVNGSQIFASATIQGRFSSILFVMSSFSPKGLLGELEQVVMLALLRLENISHAPAVVGEIEARANLTLARGTVYVVLDRLEQKGYLTSYFGEPTPERGGKAKRLFSVTAEGRQALAKTERAVSALRMRPAAGRAR